MEKNSSYIKPGPKSILWGVLAVLLCAVPCIADPYPTVESEATLNVGTGYTPVTIEGYDWVDVYGTLNMYPGAYVGCDIWAYSGSTVDIYAGEIGPGYWVWVFAGANVTVHGTDFNLGEGTHTINGLVTGFYENGEEINLEIQCAPGATVTLAAPGGPPPENTPPVAEAGPDIVATTLDVASTVIDGTATDADGDPLQYRWIEIIEGEEIEFTLWQPVGASGEATLDLATILPQYLGIGTHILTLEVSDGQEIVSDEMILTIDVQQIEIDIKPDSENNVINLGSNGVIPVAILSSADFDATALDPDSITLAGAGVAVRGKGNKYLASQKDVNGDGLVDLEIKVETENLDPGTFQNGEAVLQVFDGATEIYSGSDNVTIVPE